MTDSVIIMHNSKAISDVIWPAFKDTLEEKHGREGAQGQKGEEYAIKLISKLPNVKYIVWHQDCLSQLMGIDLTVLLTKPEDGLSVITIDVKYGTTYINWDKESKEWYINIPVKDLFSENKKNDIIMHVGIKGDVYVMYSRKRFCNIYGDVFKFSDEFHNMYFSELPYFAWTNIKK